MSVYANRDGTVHRGSCGEDGAPCPTGEHGFCPGCRSSAEVPVRAPAEFHDEGCPEVAARAGADAKLRALADALADVLRAANVASGEPGLETVANSAVGTLYWHVEQAHRLVLTRVSGGNRADGDRLHELWSDNLEDTSWNVQVLANEKRAASVVVSVAADGDTATITLPGGADCEAGRIAGSGVFWVADEVGEVIARAPAWPGVGRALADHYELPSDTAVVVEYAGTVAEGQR